MKSVLKAWVVVIVNSGIPTSVKAFSKKEKALLFEKNIRKSLSLDRDETGVFEVIL